jgi:hypothetical protein
MQRACKDIPCNLAHMTLIRRRIASKTLRCQIRYFGSRRGGTRFDAGRSACEPGSVPNMAHWRAGGTFKGHVAPVWVWLKVVYAFNIFLLHLQSIILINTNTLLWEKYIWNAHMYVRWSTFEICALVPWRPFEQPPKKSWRVLGKSIRDLDANAERIL